jgi:hypothetical protein
MVKRIGIDTKILLGCLLSFLSGIVFADEKQTELMFKILEEQRQELSSSEESKLNEGELEGDDNTSQLEMLRPMHERLNPDVRRSWDRASVYLPNKRWPTSPSNVDVTIPHTVVVYLHGCGGITTFNDGPWARFLADQGFIVVMPDSFARKGRQSNCNGRDFSTGYYPLAHILRQEEIIWARHMLSEMPWADEKNLFLMGHSEGGYAVTKYGAGGFRGIIISGYNCHWANWKDGTPALAVNYETDPWLKNSGMRCAERSGGRTIKDVILSGHEHETYFRVEAREAVKKFIVDNQYRKD